MFTKKKLQIKVMVIIIKARVIQIERQKVKVNKKNNFHLY